LGHATLSRTDEHGASVVIADLNAEKGRRSHTSWAKNAASGR